MRKNEIVAKYPVELIDEISEGELMKFGKSLMRKRVISSSLLVVKNGEYWVCGNKIKWTEFRETAWLACPVGFRRWKKSGHHI